MFAPCENLLTAYNVEFLPFCYYPVQIERQLIALRRLHGPAAFAGQSATDLQKAGVSAQDSSLAICVHSTSAAKNRSQTPTKNLAKPNQNSIKPRAQCTVGPEGGEFLPLGAERRWLFGGATLGGELLHQGSRKQETVVTYCYQIYSNVIYRWSIEMNLYMSIQYVLIFVGNLPSKSLANLFCGGACSCGLHSWTAARCRCWRCQLEESGFFLARSQEHVRTDHAIPFRRQKPL